MGLVDFLKQLVNFIKTVAEDERIPARDKRVLLALVALLISPLDLIPDWIPVIGMLDDVMIVAIVLDYFFNVLDQEILLSHYPWGMKSFVTVRRLSRFISFLTPPFLKNRIWKYEASPYRR